MWLPSLSSTLGLKEVEGEEGGIPCGLLEGEPPRGEGEEVPMWEGEEVPTTPSCIPCITLSCISLTYNTVSITTCITAPPTSFSSKARRVLS